MLKNFFTIKIRFITLNYTYLKKKTIKKYNLNN